MNGNLTLSVVVPVYNEVKTIAEILHKINAVPIDKEIIVVDDGSSDGTDRVLGSIAYNHMKLIHHTSNRGKGAAFLTGLAHASAEFVIIQDADLEYDPFDYCKLLETIRRQNVDIVLGARFFYGHKGLFLHRLGNKVLTWCMNILFGSRLNDYATCYKLAARSTWQDLNLKAQGFDMEVEFLCRALKKKKRIIEVPVHYKPRTYSQGKKIRWKDGLLALFAILKYRLCG